LVNSFDARAVVGSLRTVIQLAREGVVFVESPMEGATIVTTGATAKAYSVSEAYETSWNRLREREKLALEVLLVFDEAQRGPLRELMAVARLLRSRRMRRRLDRMTRSEQRSLQRLRANIDKALGRTRRKTLKGDLATLLASRAHLSPGEVADLLAALGVERDAAVLLDRNSSRERVRRLVARREKT
jgi:hypothetical protein